MREGVPAKTVKVFLQGYSEIATIKIFTAGRVDLEQKTSFCMMIPNR